jgi:hypothetical protein
MIHPGVSHSMAGRVDPARHRSSHEWTQFPLPTRCGAQKEINSAGGIGGRKIAITSGDSQGTPVEGVSATRRLIDLDKVDFIIGDVSSSVTLAMQPVVEDAGVLLLNAASSNPKITYAAGVGRLQMDVPQLSDRCRPHRHPICRREKRLHEVCCSLRR